eukprot:4562891-Amphidinium_carterae.1
MAAVELAYLQKSKLFGFSIDLRAAFNSTPRDLPCRVLELKGCTPDLVHLLFGWVHTTTAQFILPHRRPSTPFHMSRGWAQGLATSPLGLEMALAPVIERLRVSQSEGFYAARGKTSTPFLGLTTCNLHKHLLAQSRLLQTRLSSTWRFSRCPSTMRRAASGA